MTKLIIKIRYSKLRYSGQTYHLVGKKDLVANQLWYSGPLTNRTNLTFAQFQNNLCNLVHLVCASLFGVRTKYSYFQEVLRSRYKPSLSKASSMVEDEGILLEFSQYTKLGRRPTVFGSTSLKSAVHSEPVSGRPPGMIPETQLISCFRIAGGLAHANKLGLIIFFFLFSATYISQ